MLVHFGPEKCNIAIRLQDVMTTNVSMMHNDMHMNMYDFPLCVISVNLTRSEVRCVETVLLCLTYDRDKTHSELLDCAQCACMHFGSATR